MTVYKCGIYEIKKHFQVKVIPAFTIESLASCFFIHYIYTIHVNVVKLDDVWTRNSCFGCWTFFSSHYFRYQTHTINVCCQKESRLVVVPFASNVFRIMEVTFTPRHFIFFHFRYLVSIWPYCSYGANFILKFIDECWVVKKIVKKQGAISPFQFFKELHHILSPKLLIKNSSIHQFHPRCHSAQYPIAWILGRLRHHYQY